jgi:hypothetical protein
MPAPMLAARNCRRFITFWERMMEFFIAFFLINTAGANGRIHRRIGLGKNRVSAMFGDGTGRPVHS